MYSFNKGLRWYPTPRRPYNISPQGMYSYIHSLCQCPTPHTPHNISLKGLYCKDLPALHPVLFPTMAQSSLCCALPPVPHVRLWAAPYFMMLHVAPVRERVSCHAYPWPRPPLLLSPHLLPPSMTALLPMLPPPPPGPICRILSCPGPFHTLLFIGGDFVPPTPGPPVTLFPSIALGSPTSTYVLSRNAPVSRGQLYSSGMSSLWWARPPCYPPGVC